MSFDVRWAGYGRDASGALRDWIAAVKRAEPLQPVCVVVPTNYVGVATRRLLAGGALGPLGSRPGVAGITFLTIYRLAELLGAPALAAAGRRPVSTPVLAAAARRLLAADPGCFAPVRDHPSTAEALVAVYRELSELDDGRLAALAAASSRAADVVRLCRGARQLLAAEWYDERDLLDAATAQSARGSSLITDLGRVVLYLPQRCPPPAARLLRALDAHHPVGVIAPLAGDATADAPLVTALARLGVRPPMPSEQPAPASATAVVEVSDADEEVRAAVARIVTALRAGTALERIALLYPQPQPYARIVAEQLAAAEIGWNGHAVRPLADRIAGRWLVDVLALADRGWTRSDVLALVAGAPVVDGTGAHIRSARWERVSRDAGIDRDLASWSSRLRRYAAQQRRRADTLIDPEESPEWRAAQCRRAAADADALRAFVETLAHRLTAVDAAASWSGFAARLRTLLRTYLGGPRRRERWPEAERLAAERVELALDRLAVLDAIEPEPTPAILRSTLEAELDDDLQRVGRLGQGVLVGTLTAGLGLDLDVVLVLGLAEGVLPGAPHEDSLLPDAERRHAGADLPLAVEQVALTQRQLLAALGSAQTERILITPRGDLRHSVERPPSRWLLDCAARLSGPSRQAGYELPAHADWLHRVPSFAARVTRAVFPSTEQEYRLRALADADRSGGAAADHQLTRDDDALRLGTALLQARRSPQFTRFDGNLATLRSEIPSPADPGAITAPTRLERWARCPHQYLLYDVLGVRPPLLPEDRVVIEPLAYGQLVHQILEDWVTEFDKTLIAADDPWPPASLQRLREIAKSWCAVYEADGLVGHRVLWHQERQRLLEDLERFAVADQARRTALGVRPIAVEHGFGIAGAAAPPVHLGLGAGRQVALRGKIDRVDEGEDGRLVVTDYKTGRFSAIPRDDPMARGTKLQLVAYALAAAEHFGGQPIVRSEYWFVTSRGEFRQAGYDVDAAIADAYRTVVTSIVDGIEAGVFPPHPDQTSYGPVRCEFCDPDQGGSTRRYAEWERKRCDPAVAAYVALAEPDFIVPGA